MIRVPGRHPLLQAGLALLRERFTPRGQGLLVGLLVVCALRLGAIAHALTWWMAALAAVLAAAWLAGLPFRARVELRRQLPGRPVAGRPFPYRVSLRSTAPRVLRELELRERGLPLGVEEGAPCLLERLEPGERRELSLELRFPRRGAYLLPGLQAASSFPAGLVRLGGRQREPLRLLVHPEPAPLPAFELPGAIHDGVGDRPHWERGEEPSGLRPWRDGDRPGELCWPAYARTGRLMVRDRPRPRRARRALLVDLRAGGDGDLFERTVSMGATLVDRLSSQGLAVLGLGPALHLLPEGEGAREAALDRLAEAREHAAWSVATLPEGLAGVVVLLCGWDAEREACLAVLKARGLALSVLRADLREAS